MTDRTQVPRHVIRLHVRIPRQHADVASPGGCVRLLRDTGSCLVFEWTTFGERGDDAALEAAWSEIAAGLGLPRSGWEILWGESDW